jgi:hypothetical protein
MKLSDRCVCVWEGGLELRYMNTVRPVWIGCLGSESGAARTEGVLAAWQVKATKRFEFCDYQKYVSSGRVTCLWNPVASYPRLNCEGWQHCSYRWCNDLTNAVLYSYASSVTRQTWLVSVHASLRPSSITNLWSAVENLLFDLGKSFYSIYVCNINSLVQQYPRTHIKKISFHTRCKVPQLAMVIGWLTEKG